jgi:hypothetical protein
MPGVLLEIDNPQTNTLVLAAAAKFLVPLPHDGGGNLGPFGVRWHTEVSFGLKGTQLVAPNSIRFNDGEIDFHIDLTLTADLNRILPELCLPQVCTPDFFGIQICSPSICIPWPTISFPISYSASTKFTVQADFDIHKDASNWVVDILVPKNGIKSLQIDTLTAALLELIGTFAAVALLEVPFIGPFLFLAVEVIVSTIAVTGALGFLQDVLTPFLTEMKFHLYTHSEVLQVLPADPPLDPTPVNVLLQNVQTIVRQQGNNTFFDLSAEIGKA